MTRAEIKKKVLGYNDWEFWAERPFNAFLLSFWKKGATRQYMRNVGVDAEWPAILYENGGFHFSQKVWDSFARQLEKYLASGHTVFEVTASCENYYKTQKPMVIKLANEHSDPIKRLEKLYEILTQIISYLWLAHGFEHVYLRRLQKEVPKHVRGDVDKFIGDISFPVKKNAHVYMAEALRRGDDIKQVTQKFAWIKIRDGFSDGFSEADMRKERQKLAKQPPAHWKRPHIPKPLAPLVKVAQELVYFRTFRTDMLYEFLHLARPLLKEVAATYNIPFKELRYYSIFSLIESKPKKYPHFVTAAAYGKNFAFFTKPILPKTSTKLTEAKGSIAFMGKVAGKVKVVKIAHEIGKVKKGDILVAPTTFPSFIMGMKLAAAFVTDEGGLTSHAAIVAREMKKPCIIGTKIATKIFKDGDMIEVDANRGIVKKL